jgi:hypothetical protein
MLFTLTDPTTPGAVTHPGVLVARLALVADLSDNRRIGWLFVTTISFLFSNETNKGTINMFNVEMCYVATVEL